MRTNCFTVWPETKLEDVAIERDRQILWAGAQRLSSCRRFEN